MDTTTLGREFYAALDAQNWSRVRSLVRLDLVVRVGSLPPITFDEWSEHVTAIYGAFPDGHHVIEEYLVDGDRFVTSCRFEGTHSGPFAGTAATGRHVSVRAIHIDRFQDGLLAAHHGQIDMIGLLQQIDPASG